MNGCYRDMWDDLKAQVEADRARNTFTPYLPSQLLETMNQMEVAYVREELDKMFAYYEAEGVKP